MKRDVTCKICVQVIGRVHGHQVGKALRDHVVREHPYVYGQIMNSYEIINALEDMIQENFGVYKNDLFYYQRIK